MILILISLALFTAYLTYAISVIKDIPWSISDTYYQLGKRARPKWLFQLAMIVPAMVLLPAWLDASTENTQFLAFLSCAGLMFVGSAPCFKLEVEGKVHYVATTICGLSAVSWMVVTGYYYIPLTLILISVVLMLRYKRWMFWLEVALFASLFATLIIDVLLQ